MISDKQKLKLIDRAKQALNNAYPAIVENFTYSAAVLTNSGEIYFASNYRSNDAISMA